MSDSHSHRPRSRATPIIKRIVACALAGLLLLGVLASCGGEGSGDPEIRIDDAWARATTAGPPANSHTGHGSETPTTSPANSGETTAIYLTIHNPGSAADQLTSVQTDAAQAAELHETAMDGTVMRMRPVRSIEIPADRAVELKPGGLHIMLVGLTRELAVGETIELTLHFAKSGDLRTTVQVRQS